MIVCLTPPGTKCVVVYPYNGAIPYAYGPFDNDDDGKASKAVAWMQAQGIYGEGVILFLNDPSIGRLT